MVLYSIQGICFSFLMPMPSKHLKPVERIQGLTMGLNVTFVLRRSHNSTSILNDPAIVNYLFKFN